MRNLGYIFDICPHIAHISRLLKLKLSSRRLYEIYWRTSELNNSKGIRIWTPVGLRAGSDPIGLQGFRQAMENYYNLKQFQAVISALLIITL